MAIMTIAILYVSGYMLFEFYDGLENGITLSLALDKICVVILLGHIEIDGIAYFLLFVEVDLEFVCLSVHGYIGREYVESPLHIFGIVGMVVHVNVREDNLTGSDLFHLFRENKLSARFSYGIFLMGTGEYILSQYVFCPEETSCVQIHYQPAGCPKDGWCARIVLIFHIEISHGE